MNVSSWRIISVCIASKMRDILIDHEKIEWNDAYNKNYILQTGKYESFICKIVRYVKELFDFQSHMQHMNVIIKSMQTRIWSSAISIYQKLSEDRNFKHVSLKVMLVKYHNQQLGLDTDQTPQQFFPHKFST